MNTDPRILEDKRTYRDKAVAAGVPLPPFTTEPSRLALDRDLGRVTAHAFNDLKHDPADPETRAAYDALKRETKAQYDHLVSRGVRFEPWTTAGQPYKDSADMARDARENRHLYYFPSKAGFGTDDRFKDHPLMEQAPGHPEGTVYNDLFRAVHDWFAHAMHGHQFGPQGELRAWHEHARMYSPTARKALTTETHGQNSWVNFGPHLRGDEGPLDKPFADQKAGVLPDRVHPPVKLARLSVGAPKQMSPSNPVMHHELHDEAGSLVGRLHVIPRDDGRHLHIQWVGGPHGDEASNLLGAEAMRSVLHGLAGHYPEAQFVSGNRVSGFRGAAGRKGEKVVVAMPRVKLARPQVVTGRGAAVREQGSDNHQQRLALAKQVLNEAGLRATVKAVLAHSGTSSRPAVAVQAVRASDPQHALFAAAWLGLLTQEPSVTVFSPGEGQDALHVIDSPHPPDMVADYLRKSGVKSFTTEQRPAGTRVYAVNPDTDMATLARGVHGEHSQFNGRADRIGGGAGSGAASGARQSAARAGYRTVIRDAERAAGFGTGPAA